MEGTPVGLWVGIKTFRAQLRDLDGGVSLGEVGLEGGPEGGVLRLAEGSGGGQTCKKKVFIRFVVRKVFGGVVITDDGRLVELQGTAEQAPFSRSELDAMLTLAESGLQELMQAQRLALSTATGSAI